MVRAAGSPAHHRRRPTPELVFPHAPAAAIRLDEHTLPTQLTESVALFRVTVPRS
jgi:hypothetical protein